MHEVDANVSNISMRGEDGCKKRDTYIRAASIAASRVDNSGSLSFSNSVLAS